MPSALKRPVEGGGPPAPASLPDPGTFEIFATAPPGLEHLLRDEAAQAGFSAPRAVPGGVTFSGGWAAVRHANLHLRGAGKVLARIAEFRVLHIAQLDKRARRVDWAGLLRPDVPVRVEATTHASRVYHAGAAADRIARAIADATGAPVAATGGRVGRDAGEAHPTDAAGDDTRRITVRARIDDDLCTLSLDTSGAPLHRRGLKQAVGKAPMRETLAALFLRRCGFDGSEPVLDPMCGSGTFVIEAAEIAMGLAPGRARGFAFEHLAGFDAALWATERAAPPGATALTFHGSDRDDGAIRGAQANAERAGVAQATRFTRAAISDLARPEGPPGLIMINPPYGARIGERRLLFGLYGALGGVLRDRFAGWRVGLITADSGLARATGLPFLPTDGPVPHGGLKVQLFRTAPLG